MAELHERAHRELDGRRLAGAAHREVAHRHHGHAEPAALEHAARVEPVARAEEPAIAAGGHAKNARAGGADPALPGARDARAQVAHRLASLVTASPRLRLRLLKRPRTAAPRNPSGRTALTVRRPRSGPATPGPGSARRARASGARRRAGPRATMSDSTASTRSGWRGARINASPGCSAAAAACAASAASSSPPCVLPAIHTR